MEALGFVLFAAERFDYLLADNRFLEDFVQFRSVVLRAAGGSAYALAEAYRRHENDRQHGHTDEAQPPVTLQNNVEKRNRRETLTEPVGEHARRRHLDLVDVAHHGRHDPAR